jgi:hypothetical protein
MERNALIDLMENAEVAIHLFIKDNKLIIMTDKEMTNDNIFETLAMFSSYVLLDGLDKPPDSMLQ